MHDDALLVHEHLALHNFRSPYTTTFRAKPPSALLFSNLNTSLPVPVLYPGDQSIFVI